MLHLRQFYFFNLLRKNWKASCKSQNSCLNITLWDLNLFKLQVSSYHVIPLSNFTYYSVGFQSPLLQVSSYIIIKAFHNEILSLTHLILPYLITLWEPLQHVSSYLTLSWLCPKLSFIFFSLGLIINILLSYFWISTREHLSNTLWKPLLKVSSYLIMAML